MRIDIGWWSENGGAHRAPVWFGTSIPAVPFAFAILVVVGLMIAGLTVPADPPPTAAPEASAEPFLDVPAEPAPVPSLPGYLGGEPAPAGPVTGAPPATPGPPPQPRVGPSAGGVGPAPVPGGSPPAGPRPGDPPPAAGPPVAGPPVAGPPVAGPPVARPPVAGAVPGGAGTPAGTPPISVLATIAPGGSGVRGTYRVVDSAVALFIGEVAVRNDSPAAAGWQVSVQFPAGVGQLFTAWVNGAPPPTTARNGQTYVFTSSQPVPAGAVAELRFSFARSGTVNTPVACSVNGVGCAQG